MRSKKGIGAEVDWILALGIFLLSLGTILVLFKPGINPVFQEETLLEIVQTGIEENLTWSLTKQPLFTEPVRYIRCNRLSGSLCSRYTTEDSTSLTPGRNIIEFIGECAFTSATGTITSCSAS